MRTAKMYRRYRLGPAKATIWHTNFVQLLLDGFQKLVDVAFPLALGDVELVGNFLISLWFCDF
jgi:hypothetical protein